MATLVNTDAPWRVPTTGEELLKLPDGMHGELCTGVFVPCAIPTPCGVPTRRSSAPSAWPTGCRKGVVEGAPNLTVAVLSPSNMAVEMQRKPTEYLAAGALPRFLQGDDVLDGGDLLPGFSTPIAAFFAGLPPLEATAEPSAG